MSGRHVVGRELRGHQVQIERAFLADGGGIGHRGRVTGEQCGHFGARPQMRSGTGRQESIGVVQAAPPADRCHRGGHPARLRGGVMRPGGGDDLQAELHGEIGQRVVVLVVGRQQLGAELDDDILPTETIHQGTDLGTGSGRSAAGQRPPHPTLPATGGNQPIVSGGLRQRIQIVDRPTLFAAVQLGAADLYRQPVVSLLTAGQYQQVIAHRVGDSQLRFGQTQGEFGSVECAERGVGGSLGKPDDAVETVVIGDRQRVQPEPKRLGHQHFRGGCTVEKAERGMAVQFGVGHPGRRISRFAGRHPWPDPLL